MSIGRLIVGVASGLPSPVARTAGTITIEQVLPGEGEMGELVRYPLVDILNRARGPVDTSPCVLLVRAQLGQKADKDCVFVTQFYPSRRSANVATSQVAGRFAVLIAW